MFRLLWLVLLGMGACSLDRSPLVPPEPDAGLIDASSPDSRAPLPDAFTPIDAPVDAGPPELRRCGELDVNELLVVYSFDGIEGSLVVPDARGGRDARVTAPALVVTGPEGCGDAITFAADSLAFMTIDHNPALALPAGGIDFWLRLGPSDGLQQGIISRDARGISRSGHLTLFRAVDGRLRLRLQTDRQFAGTDERTADPIPIGQWMHIGISYGPPGLSLFVDGVVGIETTDTLGIDGNDNPWVIGVNSAGSMEGQAEPVREPFAGGAIDHLRIWRGWQDFSRPLYRGEP